MKISALFLILFVPLSVRAQDPITTEKAMGQEKKESSPQEDKWLGSDKVFHVFGSVVITGMGSWAHGRCHRRGLGQDIRFGMGLTFSLGILKELLDEWQDTNRFSWRDMIANLMGIFLGALLLTST